MMKHLMFLSVLSVFAISCKPVNTIENLPKPLPERPNDNVGSGTLDQEESQEMERLKAEITALAHSEKCSNPTDWKTVGLGVKACGGPVSYIAYSNKIDENAFLQKVDLYNQKMSGHNKKHNLTSDCMVVMQPENIACENEKPVFK